jgi:hypothetical protein
MKNIAWCLLLLCQCALGQTSNLVKTEELTDVTGNPYLFKDWSDGVVRFASGRSMTQFKLKFDCFKNILLLQFDGNVFAADAKVNEFVLYTKTGKTKDSMLFRKGFPAIDRFSDATYYQVLFQGKVQLLRLILRNVIEEKQIVTVNGQTSRHLESAEQYYLFQNGQLALLPDSKSELATSFKDQKAAIAAFIDNQQLKMRNADDFVQVVNKYNELLP